MSSIFLVILDIVGIAFVVALDVVAAIGSDSFGGCRCCCFRWR